MLRLPLVGGNELVIFGKNIAVTRCFERKHSNPDGDIETFETVRLQDGNHNNGGWQIKLPFELVLQRVQKHLEESPNA